MQIFRQVVNWMSPGIKHYMGVNLLCWSESVFGDLKWKAPCHWLGQQRSHQWAPSPKSLLRCKLFIQRLVKKCLGGGEGKETITEQRKFFSQVVSREPCSNFTADKQQRWIKHRTNCYVLSAIFNIFNSDFPLSVRQFFQCIIDLIVVFL